MAFGSHDTHQLNILARKLAITLQRSRDVKYERHEIHTVCVWEAVVFVPFFRWDFDFEILLLN